jgi:hypothetical protein
MGHDEPTLLAFLEGTLPATEAEGFDAHLLGCESCWTAVREDGAGRDALRSLLELAPPRLQDRVRLAVQGARPTVDGAHPAGGPPRQHRAQRLVAVLGAVAVVAVTAAALRFHGQASSADPAPVAAVVELARLQSPPLTAKEIPGGVASPAGHMVKLGDQNVWLARHLVAGREVLVATSDDVFPMPSDARPVSSERGAPWLAQRGDMGLACLSRPRDMLIVGDLPAERLVEFGHQLAAR